MDAGTIRRAVYDLFKFNPKDFLVQGSPTGYQISLGTKSNNSSVNGGFKCIASTLEGEPAVRVFLGLINSILPDGMSLGDLPPYVIKTKGLKGYSVLAAVVSDLGDEHDGELISAYIDVFEDDFPDNLEDTFYLAIGTYNTTDGGTLVVTPGGDGNGVGDQQFELCGLIGGTPRFWPA